ncbi:class I SAM-dependent methyltransferase [Proteocatella sphenisci]|uniref:class I SAM-dependent methyltransferase n=1 Tax=Proteocatella sphenisci TaxID=181070 RepID=UPI00049143A5|nr:SAM-dependent methyltransferase [Proteocatella sphenisci]
MEKKTIAKLKLFFSGIESRYDEQKDFFKEMNVAFKSGTKTFTGSFKDNELYLNKEIKNMEFSEALNAFIDEAAKFEALEAVYIERGTHVIISADSKNVNIRYEEPKPEMEVKVESKRDYFIKASKAPALLKEIGIMTKDGKVKNDMIRKYNQIDHFIEVVEPILKNMDPNEPITIMDCACGKSYLTFVLNYYIREVMKRNCYFIGIDYTEGVIKSSRERAQRLGYKNMEFIQEDLRTYAPSRKIDMVVSLHACDIATDYAISAAIRAKAGSMIIVPCCHKELIDQIDSKELEPIYKHNIFRTRLNDLLTDSLRSIFIESYGYEVSALEYVSPLDTPKNLMIRAVKTSDENLVAKKEYEDMKKIFNVQPTMEYYVH